MNCLIKTVHQDQKTLKALVLLKLIFLGDLQQMRYTQHIKLLSHS